MFYTPDIKPEIKDIISRYVFIKLKNSKKKHTIGFYDPRTNTWYDKNSFDKKTLFKIIPEKNIIKWKYIK